MESKYLSVNKMMKLIYLHQYNFHLYKRNFYLYLSGIFLITYSLTNKSYFSMSFYVDFNYLYLEDVLWIYSICIHSKNYIF